MSDFYPQVPVEFSTDATRWTPAPIEKVRHLFVLLMQQVGFRRWGDTHQLAQRIENGETVSVKLSDGSEVYIRQVLA